MVSKPRSVSAAGGEVRWGIRTHPPLEQTAELQKDLEAIHPFPPAEIANFTKGLDEGQLRDGAPLDVVQKDTIGLMDAGAELNIPYVPL